MQSFTFTILLLWHKREQVFKKSKEQIMQLAVDGAELLKKLADETEGDFSFEYSLKVPWHRSGLCSGSM